MAIPEEESAQRIEADEHEIHVHFKTYLAVLAVAFAYCAQLTAIVGSGVLAQSIGAVFDARSQALWLSSVVSLLLAVLSMPFSQVADLWGRKWVLVICAFCDAVGFIVASRAQSMGTVIAGFTIIGFGCGCQSLFHAVASEILPRRHRPYAQTAVNCGNFAGTILALTMGTAVIGNGAVNNFRIYMYIAAGIFGLATMGLIIGYNPPPRELQELPTSEKLRRLDWLGFVFSAPGVVLFCLGLTWSKNPYPWTSARVLAPFIVGSLCLIAFVIQQWRFKKDGFVQHGLFINRNYPLGLAVAFSEGLSFFALNAFFVREISTFTGQGLLKSALHYLITFLTAIATNVLVSMYMARTRTVRLPAVVGAMLFMIFMICMGTITPSTPTVVFWIYPMIIGAGFAILQTSLFVCVQLSTPAAMILPATALMVACRGLGGTIGLAINNAIFNDALAKNIPLKVAAATLPLGLPKTSLGSLIAALTNKSQSALSKVPGINPKIIAAARHALVEAYSIGFRGAWIASACFISTAVLATMFFFDPSSEFNQHIDAPAEQSLIEEQALHEAMPATPVELREHDLKADAV